jgi:hypothetical protein
MVRYRIALEESPDSQSLRIGKATSNVIKIWIAITKYRSQIKVKLGLRYCMLCLYLNAKQE